MALWSSEVGQRTSKTDDGSAEDPSRGQMQEQLKKIERFSIQLICILSVAISFFSIAAYDAKQGVWFALFVFSVYVGEAVAAILLGGLLGFVFGIPRFLRVEAETNKHSTEPTKDAPAAANARALRSFAGNTNLEEISDWLTKIIVGVGLTQATTIYDKIVDLTNAFEKSVMGRGKGAGVFFVVVFLASTIGGFLFFYLETRTRITLLLTDADVAAGPAASWKAAINEARQAPLQTDSRYDAAKTPNLTAAQEKADRELLSVPFSSLKTAEEFAAWAAAQSRANNRQAASRAISEAVTLDPKNAAYLATMAEIRLQLGNPQGAVDAYSEMREKGQTDGTTLRRELLSTLYLAPPESFRRALAVADKLFEVDPSAKSDAQVQTWLTAAYGQQFTWLSQNSGTASEMKAARDSALAAAKNVVRLEPNPDGNSRKLLARLLDPSRSQGSSDDDLYIFQNDNEFRSVILGKDEAPTSGASSSAAQNIDGKSLKPSEPDATDQDEPNGRLPEEDQ